MIIFLDIDSVLNCYKSFQRYINGEMTNIVTWRGNGLKEFADIEFIDRLNEIKEKSNAKVIGISSWFSQRRPNDVIEISKALGIDFSDKIDNTGGGTCRLNSITRYIQKHNITKFIIIDDDPIHQTRYKEHHIMPNGDGLTEQLKEQAIKLVMDS